MKLESRSKFRETGILAQLVNKHPNYFARIITRLVTAGKCTINTLNIKDDG
jgi:hypothetical protein